MRMLATFIRVLFGFAFACLIAGAVTAAFVVTPTDIAASSSAARPEQLGYAGLLSLYAATHTAIFAFPFALIAIVVAEWLCVRSWIYYVVVGIVIALGGFAAFSYFEVEGQPTIVNDYAMRTFLTVGVFGGLAYWLVAGRRAGGRRGDRPEPAERTPEPASPETDEPPASDKLAQAGT